MAKDTVDVIGLECNRCKKDYEPVGIPSWDRAAYYANRARRSRANFEGPYLPLCPECTEKRNQYRKEASDKLKQEEAYYSREHERPFEEIHLDDEMRDIDGKHIYIRPINKGGLRRKDNK